MATKLTAARLATAAGCRMVICSSSIPDSIPHAVNGRHTGTLFHPHPTALRQVVLLLAMMPYMLCLAQGPMIDV